MDAPARDLTEARGSVPSPGRTDTATSPSVRQSQDRQTGRRSATECKRVRNQVRLTPCIRAVGVIGVDAVQVVRRLQRTAAFARSPRRVVVDRWVLDADPLRVGHRTDFGLGGSMGSVIVSLDPSSVVGAQTDALALC